MSGALRGAHALVTGGSRGIGAAIATALAADGARLSLVGRDCGRLEAQAATLRARTDVRAIVADVTDADAIETGFATAVAEFGPVGILVNNAGGAVSRPFRELDLATWRAMLDLNLTSVYLWCAQAVPAMIASNGGRIVNVASTAGLAGAAYIAAYAAAKHGVVGLTRALAAELAVHEITVNAVCPAFTETAILHDAITNIAGVTGRTPDDARAALLRAN
ncbi:MAG: SDR family NAD(P)-dependent oxidoreductase, partial [Vulcanimicrobiaceae bacterium]